MISDRFASHIAHHIAMMQTGDVESRTELDSHADSAVVGRNALILGGPQKTVSVSGFTKSLGIRKKVPIVNAAVLYTCDITGQTSILILHNALHFEEMESNLIPPFLMREAGLVVNECPKFQATKPTLLHHSVFCPQATVRMTLQLHGIISYLPTRLPTSAEVREHRNLNTIHLTPNSPDWNPNVATYQDQECSMMDYTGALVERNATPRRVCAVLPSHAAHLQGRYELPPLPSEIPAVKPLEELDAGEHDERNAEVSAVLTGVSRTLVSNAFAEDLMEKVQVDATFEDENSDRIIGAITSSSRSGISRHDLASRWNISEDAARRTLNGATTQLCIRTASPSLIRRFHTNDRMLRYNRTAADMFMDTMLAPHPPVTTAYAREHGKKPRSISTRQNSCAQIFVTEFEYVHFVPMQSRSNLHLAMKSLFKGPGVPPNIVCDGAKEQVGGPVRKICQQSGCNIKELEKGTSWSNRAERSIFAFQEAIRLDMKKAGSPMAYWDYCGERRARIMNATAKDIFMLQGQTPHSFMTGQPTDISHLCEFAWYEWVYFRDSHSQFPLPSMILGRCLGPAESMGTEMSQHVLLASGKILPKQSLRHLTREEWDSPIEAKKRSEFDSGIEKKYGGPAFAPLQPITVEDVLKGDEEDGTMYEVDDGRLEKARQTVADQDFTSMPEADTFPDLDHYLNAEVLLPNGEHMQAATVMIRSKDANGRAKGRASDNPILDTRVYDVLFPDGVIKQYAANVLAEAMYSQVDDEGHRYQLLDSIVSHRKDHSAVDIKDGYIIINGRKSRATTTQGWFFNVKWKDGSTSELPLRDMKESNPIEVAEYATKYQLEKEPAFAWWVPWIMKKRNRIISAVNQRTRQTSRKYGIEVPSSVEEAHRLDTKNGNTYWRDAITKEMKNVAVAFRILDEGETPSPKHTFVPCHLIFTVKMDFTRKCRYVANGGVTPTPVKSTYAGVVSRESVRIAFTYAALNDLEVMAADIQNAYLQAPISEKYWTTCGREFGEDCGKKALVVRALYGCKSAGADFRNHLRSCMDHLGYQSCLADPDVWMRSATRADGEEYYEYMLLYVDDCLCVSERARDALMQIDKYFKMKPESIGPPKIYLGGTVSQVVLENGVTAYAFSSSKYVQEAIKNVDEYLEERERKLQSKARNPLSSEYRPEIDVSPELDPVDCAYYQSLIGILRWIVELGRVDICVEVSMMSSHLALPREGHMEQVLHIFAYLKVYHNARMVFDPTYPEVNDGEEVNKDWTTFYGNVREIIPPGAPKRRGKGFLMKAFVDADHAGDLLTRRSRTGFLVYLNMAPIYWLSKKQTSIETSTFGSEFVAMKHCCEYIRGLRYKLRMMGIPCEDPSFIYGDNQSVLYNTTLPESTLKKKSNSIAYHFVREGAAMGEWVTSYVRSGDNPSDILTKPVPSGQNRQHKVGMVLYDIYD